MTLEEISERISSLENIVENLIRIGTVFSIDATKGTARVEFVEEEHLTADLPYMQQRSGDDKDYTMPSSGERVAVLFLPIGVGRGFILGSIYDESNEPPLSNRGQRAIVSGDLRLGAYGATDPVALSGQTDSNFAEVRDKFNAHFHVTPSGPSDPPSALQQIWPVPLAPPSTAASKVKAE